jgi:glycine hydroxymethyltransferase
MQPSFTDYQKHILENAHTLAAELKKLGLRLVSGGTDNHLILVDLSAKNVNGRQAEVALGLAGIIVNRNAIPYDTLPPLKTSGIRVGTPAVTSRGFGKEEMKFIAARIVKVISSPEDKNVLDEVKEEVAQMCRKFPVPGVDD